MVTAYSIKNRSTQIYSQSHTLYLQDSLMLLLEKNIQPDWKMSKNKQIWISGGQSCDWI